MSSIVCNTGPIIALTGIRKLDIMKSLYDTVYLPEAVNQEIIVGGAQEEPKAAELSRCVLEIG